ncbi:MAG TPA: AraC family transcriptional regulator [Terriglobales bacterium]|jgi:AraC family transcriptional regulator|nr:AraC family transcriptional regulator [Terriglobales bacterium]
MGNIGFEAGRERALRAGNFYGAVESKREQCGAIFTNLRHASPKKLPAHVHELAFFALLLEGEYGERYEQQDRQFRPFTIHFRPAGIPHQDEVGPRGVRFFEIEIRPSWRERLTDYSAALDVAHDDCAGGPLLWLEMKMYCEFVGSDAAGNLVADELGVESLLAEMLGCVARMRCENVDHPPAWLGRVVEKLAAEYSERLTLDELSAEAGIHPVHLSRVFRKFVREGIGERVHRLRIRSACEQMLTRELSMAEISLATGYADQSHFTRAFRRATGMTPAAFRRQLTAA